MGMNTEVKKTPSIDAVGNGRPQAATAAARAPVAATRGWVPPGVDYQQRTRWTPGKAWGRGRFWGCSAFSIGAREFGFQRMEG